MEEGWRKKPEKQREQSDAKGLVHFSQLKEQSKDNANNTSAVKCIGECPFWTGIYAMFRASGGTTDHFLVARGTNSAVEGLSGRAGSTGRVTLLAGRTIEEVVDSIVCTSCNTSERSILDRVGIGSTSLASSVV